MWQDPECSWVLKLDNHWFPIYFWRASLSNHPVSDINNVISLWTFEQISSREEIVKWSQAIPGYLEQVVIKIRLLDHAANMYLKYGKGIPDFFLGRFCLRVVIKYPKEVWTEVL